MLGRRAATVPLADTEEVFDYNHRINSVQTTEQAIREIRQYQERQHNLEEQYINQSHPCQLSQIKRFQDHLGNIDSEKYKQVISDNFYDPNVMKAAMCIADSIFYTQPLQSGAVSANQRIREWLRNLKQIGAESVEGYALRADFEDASNLFIVKAPRDPENAELIHELFVGIQLNSLRATVPNFAYVFGGFKCSPPVIDSTKEVVAWCNNTNVSVHYVLYENVVPAKSMKEYVENCTFPQWLDKYLQIMYALSAAQKKIDFTHYDLHDENVLIRDIGETEKFSIPYETERGGTEYLLTDGIATVIDYGFSHVKYKDQHFGVWDKMAWGVFPRRSFPLHDAYKLLLMSMRSMRDAGNIACFEGASHILKFFNRSESAEEIIEQQAQTYYFLPYNDLTASKNIFDLTTYIREELPVVDQIIREQPGNERLIGCAGTDVCVTGQEVVRRVGATGPMRVDTVFEFYDLVTRLIEEGRNEDVQQVVKDFEYDKIVRESLNKYTMMFEDLDLLYRKGEIMSIVGLPVEDLFDRNILAQYKNSTARIAEMYDHVQNIGIYKDAIKFAATFYEDTETFASVEAKYFDVSKYFDTVRIGVDSLRRDQSYLNEVSSINNSYVNEMIRRDRQFLWWWKGLQSVLSIFA